MLPVPCKRLSMARTGFFLLVALASFIPNQSFLLRGISPARKTPSPCMLKSPAGHVHDSLLSSHRLRRDGPVVLKAVDDGEQEDPGLGIKAAWYGSELFGNIIGLGKKKEQESESEMDSLDRVSRSDAVARLKNDFDRFYFVTGQMDLDLYEPDCVFADPFVSFEGRDRFKNNLDNLGSLMQDVTLDVTKWEETEASIKTKWRFRCVLGLPWKPTLAAAGGTEFFFNPDSGRIERHVESWEIKPIDALKQLVRPGRKKANGS